MFSLHIPGSGELAGHNWNSSADTLLERQVQATGNASNGPTLAQRCKLPLRSPFSKLRFSAVAGTSTHLLVALSMVLEPNYRFAVNLVEIRDRSQEVIFDFIHPRLDSGLTTRRPDERHSILNMWESGIDRLRRGVVQGQGRRTGGERARWAGRWWV